MKAKIFGLVLSLLIAAPTFAAGWYAGPTVTSGTAVTAIKPSSSGNGAVYFTFTSSDLTTSSGPALDSSKCTSLTATLMDGAASSGVKLWAGDDTITPGTSTSSSNLAQITGDAAGAAIDCSTPSLCGVRDFTASRVIPTITSACSTGTCALEVTCR